MEDPVWSRLSQSLFLAVPASSLEPVLEALVNYTSPSVADEIRGELELRTLVLALWWAGLFFVCGHRHMNIFRTVELLNFFSLLFLYSISLCFKTVQLATSNDIIR